MHAVVSMSDNLFALADAGSLRFDAGDARAA